MSGSSKKTSAPLVITIEDDNSAVTTTTTHRSRRITPENNSNSAVAAPTSTEPPLASSHKRRKKNHSLSTKQSSESDNAILLLEEDDFQPTQLLSLCCGLDDTRKPSAIQEKNHSADDDAYRKALGPLRMQFVDNNAFPRGHTFQSQPQSLRGCSSNPHRTARKIYRELNEYQLNLPVERQSAIFVRALEHRVDLVRAMITGPEGTPYAYGCFFFDIHLENYPDNPPKVKFLTTASGTVRFNPNLYKCGKVCLSLLGTWSTPTWVAKESTLLQVLVSIQGLVLGAVEPYYNEPGHLPNTHSKKRSDEYSRERQKSTIEHAVLAYLQQIQGDSTEHYPEFRDVIEAHFYEQGQALLDTLEPSTKAVWGKQDKSLKKGSKIYKDLTRRLATLKESMGNLKRLAVASVSSSNPEVIVID